MKFKKWIALLAVLTVLAGMAAGCAAETDSAGEIAYSNKNTSLAESSGSSQVDSGSGTESITPEGQKLIRTWYISAETEDMDPLLTDIEQQVAALGGYVESRRIYNGSSYSGTKRYRSATLTVRIPAELLNQFVTSVSDASNITSSKETAEDVTLSYVATESRIKALETEQTRLLELLAQAESMDDLLLIESRLTEVRTELEEVTSQLRLYDNLVDYGTVNLELSEVREYTVVEEPENIWQRMGQGFVENLKGLGSGLTEFAVFIVSSLPYLLLIAAVITAVTLLIRRSVRKKKQTPPQPPQ